MTFREEDTYSCLFSIAGLLFKLIVICVVFSTCNTVKRIERTQERLLEQQATQTAPITPLPKDQWHYSDTIYVK